jgi:hypothetical protein
MCLNHVIKTAMLKLIVACIDPAGIMSEFYVDDLQCASASCCYSNVDLADG